MKVALAHLRETQGITISGYLDDNILINYGSTQTALRINQSINQSNPVLLKERVRIPRTRRAGGAAML